MLTIIGGTYREICLAPTWDDLYGSGLRAALALVDIVPEIQLYTYASAHEKPRLEAYEKTHSIGLVIYPREGPIEWQYDHSAGSPRLLACDADHGRQDQFSLPRPDGGELEHVLAYSFIECPSLPTFSAEYAIYDPQTGKHSKPFPADRCTVAHLAVVANLTEARAIAAAHQVKDAEKKGPRQLARAILQHDSAEVVVIKNGIFGTHVATNNHSAAHIPALKTERYFGIGSGDIFSAVFAAQWADQGCDPVEAAELAAAATAHYCNSDGVLPLPQALADLEGRFEHIDLERISQNGIPKKAKPVYLAGPFFSLPQRWLINQARDALRSYGLVVWSPWAEAGLLPQDATPSDVSRIASADLAALRKCGSVFAFLDQMDAGTVFEVGYAIELGLPVTVYAENTRPSDLTMFRGTDCLVSDDFSSALLQAVTVAYGL